MAIRLDLHIHSESRGRVFINAEQLKDSLQRSGLDGVAITNFFSLDHAFWLKEKVKDYIIIVGQEIHTRDGHIIGLGLKKRIDDDLGTQDTVAQIHEQGGIVVAVHPYLFFGLGRKLGSLGIDAIEVYNGLTGALFFHNYRAKKMAEELNVSQVASSDTTDAKLIGRSFTEIITDSEKLILQAIRENKVRLFKKPLPVPLSFIFKNLFNFHDLEPCPLHAVPCFVCGKSMAIRLFRTRYRCLDCGKVFSSRIACSNGHYICKDCIIGRGREISTGRSQ